VIFSDLLKIVLQRHRTGYKL